MYVVHRPYTGLLQWGETHLWAVSRANPENLYVGVNFIGIFQLFYFSPVHIPFVFARIVRIAGRNIYWTRQLFQNIHGMILEVVIVNICLKYPIL